MFSSQPNMQSQDQNKTLTFPVDIFAIRGPSIPDGASLSIAEMIQFHTAYQQFSESIRELELTFFNGKAIALRYSFDATRPEEDRLLINWDYFMPLFGKAPESERDFVRLPTIQEFIEKEVRFEKCTAVAGDTCGCGKEPNEVVSPGRECTNLVHWHHYCTAHVSAWLTKYMVPAILLKESKEMFSAISDCTDTQVLLDSAWNISNSGSGADASK